VLDLSQPWTIEQDLKDWTSCIQTFKNEHFVQIPLAIVCNKVDLCDSVNSLKDDGLEYIQ
jgi:hypothetical protein